MAINKKAPIDFETKRIKPVKEFLLIEAVMGTARLLPNEVADIVFKYGKTYYKCKNPKFVETV